MACFDSECFEELRELSENNLAQSRVNGIDGYVPHVGELCRDGHVTGRFLEATLDFVRVMQRTPYRFDTFFRAYPRHVVNFPKGRAFRKQWNVGFTAGDGPGEDYMRIGVGFRLSAHEEAHGIEEYLEFRKEVARRQAAFDSALRALGNYYEIGDEDPPGPWTAGVPTGSLAAVFVADQPPLKGWRFFGKRLWVNDQHDYAVVSSHERLRDVAVETFNQIRAAGFGQ